MKNLLKTNQNKADIYVTSQFISSSAWPIDESKTRILTISYCSRLGVSSKKR